MPTHSALPARTAALCLLLGVVLGHQGCGPKELPPPAPAATPSAPAPAAKTEVSPSTSPVPAAPSAAAAKASAPPAAQPAVKPAPAASVVPVSPATAPAPEPKPAAPAAAPSQVQSPVSDPGGEVAVKPTKAGLSRVGMTSCKMCHKVQFASWSDSAHARRNPPLDCESCHGPGSEYKSIGVMKDPDKARAAGLVLPGPAFCATCHKRNWTDGMLKKAHAHKA